MRDMYMVSNATQPSISVAQPIELTPEQELQARFRLLQALQTSLNLSDLLNLFYKHMQPIVAVGGLKFAAADQADSISFGRTSLHHCDYRLSMDDGLLGTIIFCRGKRFDETELARIELLLSYLVHPLRNALQHEKALRLTMLDPLTLVGNRAALDAALRRELQMAERYKYPLSLLVADADHFKLVNDQFGHTCGDQVLQEIARNIQSVCRATDECFRYGGEEFVVLLPRTHAIDALVIGERIRQKIESLLIDHPEQPITTSVSLGIAGFSGAESITPEQLFKQADKALYRAKSGGRNRVML